LVTESTQILDSREIDISERILARQVYPEIRERFLKEREERLKNAMPEIAPAAEEHSKTGNQELTPEDLERKREEFQHKPVEHTPEARLQAARDLEKLKPSDKPKPIEMKKAPGSDILFGPDGRILQKNQGKWNFKFEETPKTWILDVEISKFIDTSLLDVDVHPTWIRVTIKGKYLQLLLPEEVKVDGVVCERSKLTGHLAVTMLKAKDASSSIDIIEVRKEERRAKEQREKDEKEATEKAKKEAANRNRRYERLFDPKEAVNIHNIFEESKKTKMSKPLMAGGIQDVKLTKTDVAIPEDFEDDPEVPPLC
jgi:protein TilB